MLNSPTTLPGTLPEPVGHSLWGTLIAHNLPRHDVVQMANEAQVNHNA